MNFSWIKVNVFLPHNSDFRIEKIKVTLKLLENIFIRNDFKIFKTLTFTYLFSLPYFALCFSFFLLLMLLFILIYLCQSQLVVSPRSAVCLVVLRYPSVKGACKIFKH